MGFNRRWVHLIMQCIKTVSYSVLFNGVPTRYIKSSGGIHQGDPLSPYLFIIYVEGLTSLFRQVEASGSLRGLSISRGGPQISHLFFADDSLIFCRVSLEDFRTQSSILHLYKQASGQKLNQEKTALFFSSNTSQDVRNVICIELRTSSTGKYWEIPRITAYYWLGEDASVHGSQTKNCS